MGERIDNEFYDRLGERWYAADDDPIALLRAESRLRNPWIAATLRAHFAGRESRDLAVLDIGCGGGFLANALAREGFRVSGVDLSDESLRVARLHDTTGSVRYECHDARSLPHADASFDAACAMDFLEHVEDPAAVIRDAARVLKPGGLFFFHTFNRTLAAWLLAAKGLEWAVRNAPPDIHLHRLFIKPQELEAACAASGLDVREIVGVKPVIFSRAFGKLLLTGRVSPDFRFEFSSSRAVGYSGWACKRLLSAVPSGS